MFAGVLGSSNTVGLEGAGVTAAVLAVRTEVDRVSRADKRLVTLSDVLVRRPGEGGW